MTDTMDDLEAQFEQVLARFQQKVQNNLQIDPPKDFNRTLQEMYEQKRFLDLELLPDRDHNRDYETIKVHKIVLLINDCTAIANHSGNIFPIKNVSPNVIKAIVHYFYYRDLALDIGENNEEVLELSKQLGIETLADKMFELKKLQKMVTHFQEVVEPLNRAIKRPNEKHTPQSQKRVKFDTTNSKDREKNDYSSSAKTPKKSTEDRPTVDKPTVDESREDKSTEDEPTEVEPTEDEQASEQVKAKKTTEITLSNTSDQKANHDMTNIRSSKQNNLLQSLSKTFTSNSKKTKPTPNLNAKRLSVSAQTNESKPNLNFEPIKFLTHAKNPLANVWQSYFVPKESGSNLVATVGGSVVNWFDLDQECYLSNVFNAPSNKLLRSMAVSVIGQTKQSVVYGVGSNDCVYFFKHPNEKEVKKFDRLDGFKDEVQFIVFHLTIESNLMFCGTADKMIIVWNIKVDENCRIKKTECSKWWTIDTSFAVLSMVYLKDLDILIAGGESANILALNGLTNYDMEPVRFIFTPIHSHPNLRCITNVVYIAEHNLLGFRYFNHNLIELGHVPELFANKGLVQRNERLTRSAENKQSPPKRLSFKRAARLDLEMKSDSEFITMGANAKMVGCGDNAGNVFIYESSELFKDDRAVIKPFIRLTKEDWFGNKIPKIRSVSISDDRKFIVSTTDNNLICIWKRADKEDKHDTLN